MWSQRDTPAMGPPKNQKGVRVWTGTRLIELESHEFVSRSERTLQKKTPGGFAAAGGSLAGSLSPVHAGEPDGSECAASMVKKLLMPPIPKPRPSLHRLLSDTAYLAFTG